MWSNGGSGALGATQQPVHHSVRGPGVHDAIVGNKHPTADRYGISWRAVNNACVRVAREALGRVDLLDRLVAIAIDEVKYKKGHRYLAVVCDHATGQVIWRPRDDRNRQSGSSSTLWETG